MPEMINYIFDNMRNTNNTIKKMGKVLRSQTKLNRSFIFMGIATLAYVSIVDKQYKEQQKKIEALTEEVESLKCTEKGE